MKNEVIRLPIFRRARFLIFSKAECYSSYLSLLRSVGKMILMQLLKTVISSKDAEHQFLFPISKGHGLKRTVLFHLKLCQSGPYSLQ